MLTEISRCSRPASGLIALKKARPFVLTFLACVLFIVSCKKEIIPNTTCDVRGTYSGTSLTSTGVASILTYKLQDNNFASGSVTPEGPIVSFGSYSNTCDSVILSVYFSSTNSYFLLQGKLSNSGTTISGSYKNLTTTSDFGTFTIIK